MMFKYSYITRNNYKEDIIRAVNLDEAMIKLDKKNIQPLTINRFYDLNNLDRGKLSKKKVIVLCDILINCLNSGLPLATIFSLLKEQAPKTEKAMYRDILNDIITGNSLADSFKNTEKFEEDFITVLRIGEANGSVQDSLTSLIENYTQSMELKAAIKQASIYPIILSVLGVAMLVFFVQYMIPNMMDLFGDTELPTYTRIYLGVLFGIRDNIIYVIGGAIASAVAYRFTPKSSKFYRLLYLFKVKYMPFHNLYASIIEINFLQTLLMFERSGAKLTNAFSTMKTLFKDKHVQEMIEEINIDVQRGESLYNAFSNSKLLSTMTLSQLNIAEQNGTMETTLTNVVKSLKKDVQNKFKALTSAMEPIFTLVISVVIGSLVIAIMLPMMNMTQNINVQQ